MDIKDNLEEHLEEIIEEVSKNNSEERILEDRTDDELIAATEAILFSMGDAVELPHLAQALEIDIDKMKDILSQMTKMYENSNRGIQVIELEGAFQLCTKKEMYDYLIKIAHVPKPKELTDVMLETLSIIAYKQPVTKLEIEKIRGVKSDHTVNKLVEYNLVCEAGRKDAPGRPILFATTEEFLRSFGIESTEELPELDQEIVEEFKNEAEAEVQDSIQLKLDI